MRYGLGRIVAWTTDDGSQYAGEVLSKANSQVITRMMNWAIETQTGQARPSSMWKTHVNAPTKVVVKSTEPPKRRRIILQDTRWAL